MDADPGIRSGLGGKLVHACAVVVCVVAVTAVTGVLASRNPAPGNDPGDLAAFDDADWANWLREQRAAEDERLAALDLPADLHSLPRATRNLDFDGVDLQTMAGVFGAGDYAAQLAVRGRVGKVVGYVAGIAQVEFEVLEWLGLRAGVKQPAARFQVSSTVTFTTGPPPGMAVLDGYAPLLPGDEVVVLLRKAQKSITLDGEGVWWPVAFRGSWFVRDGLASANVGVEGLPNEAYADAANEANTWIAWEQEYRDIPVTDLTQEIRAEAAKVGWVTTDLPAPAQ